MGELNRNLGVAERRAIAAHSTPRLPVVLIMGCGRSGSTLLYQWMCQTGLFWFPSNFISRFYAAPVLGYQIQQMLLDPDLSFGEELSGFTDSNFESALGKTRGWQAPSEFWYFWRRFFDFSEISGGRPQGESLEPTSVFVSELAALQAASGLPIAMKGMIGNWMLRDLDQLLPNVLFIHLTRDTLFNAQSLLLSRQLHSGDSRAPVRLRSRSGCTRGWLDLHAAWRRTCQEE